MKYNQTVFFVFFLIYIFFIKISLFSLSSFSIDSQRDLIQDLLVVDYWNKRLNERFPVTYNHLLQGGYFNMPSARMGEEGEIGFGYASLIPYRHYNLRVQMTSHLEITGNYRIFRHFKDPNFGCEGFGDLSERGANIKFALFTPEDSHYQLPGVAIGLDDFMGTKGFKAYYVVLTHVFLDYDLEVSVGYGADRIRKWFGGVSWIPFRQSYSDYLKGLSLVVEYDAIPYDDKEIEKHPRAKRNRTPFNVGVKYRLWNSLDFSLAYTRGVGVAFSASTTFNFGMTEGVLPKIEDALPYRAPLNKQKIGEWRPEDAFVQDYICAMHQQGFEVIEIWLSYDEDCKKTLRFRLLNLVYREERYVRERLNALLAALTPDDIDCVVIVIDADELSIQEYRYDMTHLRAYQEKNIGRYELNILTPLCEVQDIDTPHQFRRRPAATHRNRRAPAAGTG